MTVDLSSYGNTTTTYGLATDEGLANEEQRRRMETEAAMSEQYNATRASWLGNWTAGTGELTGKVLDNDLDYESLLETLQLQNVEADTKGEDGEDQDSESVFVERQVAALVRVARLRSSGFYKGELPMVEQVLKFALDKALAGERDFVEPTCNLLQCAGKPFLRTSTTDDMKYAKETVSFVETLSMALDCNMPSEVILHASDCFASIARTGTSSGRVETYITESGILLRGMECLRTLLYNSVSGNRIVGDTVVFLLLKALDICVVSNDIASLLVDIGILSCVAVVLANNTSRERVTIACQVVRNILDHSSESVEVKTTEVCQPLMSLYDNVEVNSLFFESLSSLLEDIVFKGFGMQDKDLRNEMCLLILMLAKSEQNRLAIVESQLLETIFYVATQPEILSQQHTNETTQALLAANNRNIRAFASTREPEDLELKLLTWYIIVELSKGLESNAKFLTSCADSQLIACLLLYLEDGQGNKKVQCLRRWAPYQLQHLKAEAIWVLSSLVNLLPDDFLSANGLNLALYCISNVASFQILQASMHLIHELSKIPSVKLRLSKRGVVGVVLQVFREFSRAAEPVGMLKMGMPLGTESYYVQQDAACALIAFCEEEPEGKVVELGNQIELEELSMDGEKLTLSSFNQKTFHQCQGVEVVVQDLHIVHEEQMSCPASYTLSLLHMLWKCVVNGPQKENLKKFLVLGGMELLLDIACKAENRVCSVILSILADAIERGGERAKAIWHEWKSRSDSTDAVTATHMLLEKWREEERSRRLTNEKGVIQNLERPLRGMGHPMATLKFNEGCHGVIDGFIDKTDKLYPDGGEEPSIFPRVYAVLKILGFKSLAEGEDVSCQDKATLQFIQEYVKFKQGEVWLDIAASFEKDGVKLTSFDQVRLESGIAASYSLAEQIQEKQREILEGGFLMDTMREQKFYDSILIQQQEERQGLLYKKDRGNLTMRERLEAKMKKEQMLKNSVKSAIDSLSLKNTMNALDTSEQNDGEVDGMDGDDEEAVAVAAAVAEAVAEALADDSESDAEDDSEDEDLSKTFNKTDRSSSSSNSN